MRDRALAQNRAPFPPALPPLCIYMSRIFLEDEGSKDEVCASAKQGAHATQHGAVAQRDQELGLGHLNALLDTTETL